MLDITGDFPLLRSLTADGRRFIYLDSAATTQKPTCVIDALVDWYSHMNANPHRGTYVLAQRATDEFEFARNAIAAHIGAGEDEVVFCRNTTEAINLVAEAYVSSRLQPGDEIVLPVSEHHSNFLPWQRLAKTRHARLTFLLPDENGRLSDAEIDEKIGERTRFVVCAQVSNVLGNAYPLKRIAERAHEVGALTVFDCAQGLLHCGVDVKALDADFVAFSSHKAFGPMGIGVLWGRREFLKSMSPFLLGGEMVVAATERRAVFEEAPLRFEAGTQDAAGAYAFATALEYIDSLGRDAIRQHERELTRQLLNGLAKIPNVSVYGNAEYAEDRCGIVSFNYAGQSPLMVAKMLDRDGITVRAGTHCAQPLMAYLGTNATCRISLAPYNTADDIKILLDCLDSMRDRIVAMTYKGRS